MIFVHVGRASAPDPPDRRLLAHPLVVTGDLGDHVPDLALASDPPCKPTAEEQLLSGRWRVLSILVHNVNTFR
jgi:hypothetical protein